MPGDAPTVPLNPREFLILLALADAPQHGYAILKAVTATSDGHVTLDPANLYRTLKRFHRDGLVTETPARAGERRRTFKLTAAGRRLVKAEALRVHRLAAVVRTRQLISKEELG